MRAYDGQFSDARPITRTLEQKRRLMVELEGDLSRLKSHAAPGMRQTLTARIASLRAEIGEPAPRPSAAAAPAARRRTSTPA